MISASLFAFLGRLNENRGRRTIAAGADNGAGGSLPAKVLSIRGVIGDIGGGLPSVSDLAASDLLVDL